MAYRRWCTLAYIVFLVFLNCQGRVVINSSNVNNMDDIAYTVSQPTTESGAPFHNNPSTSVTTQFSQGHYSNTRNNGTKRHVITTAANIPSATSVETETGISAWTETITNIIIMAFLGGVIVKYLKLNKVVREISTAAQEVMARRQNNRNINNDEMRRLSLQVSAASPPKSADHIDSDASEDSQPKQGEDIAFSAYRDCRQASITVHVAADTHACLAVNVDDSHEGLTSPHPSVESEFFSLEEHQLQPCRNGDRTSDYQQQTHQQTSVCTLTDSHHYNQQMCRSHEEPDSVSNREIEGAEAINSRILLHESRSLCDLEQYYRTDHLRQFSNEFSKSHGQLPEDRPL